MKDKWAETTAKTIMENQYWISHMVHLNRAKPLALESGVERLSKVQPSKGQQ